MDRANQDIRQLLQEKRIYYWEVAQKIGITDGYFSKKLRSELPPDEKDRIRGIINQISENRQ